MLVSDLDLGGCDLRGRDLDHGGAKHDEIQEKMAVTRGANMTKFKKKWPRHVARSKHDEIREKRKKIRLRAKRATYMQSSEQSKPHIFAERS